MGAVVEMHLNPKAEIDVCRQREEGMQGAKGREMC